MADIALASNYLSFTPAKNICLLEEFCIYKDFANFPELRYSSFFMQQNSVLLLSCNSGQFPRVNGNICTAVHNCNP